MGRKIIDIEASGLQQDSYPIEIAVYDIDDESQSFVHLIKPHESWTHWCYDAQNVHGLSRQYIEEDGEDAYEVCQHLKQVLSTNNVYSDAPSYEMMWLRKLFWTFDEVVPDTVLSVMHLIEWKHHQDFNNELSNLKVPHRALPDAVMIGQCVKSFTTAQSKLTQSMKE